MAPEVDPSNVTTPHPSPPPPALFAPKPTERRAIPVAVWAVSGLTLLLLVGILLLVAHRGPPARLGAQRAPDAYAGNLLFSDLQMSESTSLSGGKSTFIDGHVSNHGTQVVTGATVQVLFANDQALPPQVETLPVTLIRTREPYVDTQPLSAAPLAPGATRDFRLIFENIGDNWNQQLPQIQVVSTARHVPGS